MAIQAQAAKVHTATVYHWLKLYERTGRVSALLPIKPNGGRGKSRLSQEVEAVIKDTLENYYLKQQKPSAQKTCLDVIRLCRQAKLKPPHPNTVRQRIVALSEELKMKRRRGAKAAREKFEPAAGAFPGADWPLAYVQIDHTTLEIILADDLHRLPVGRPWITLAVDVFSRMVTGFYVSFDPPGSMSVGLCLTHSILPKEKWLAKYNISTPWPCWGLMGTLHADNAGEFRGQMLKRACAEYGINLEWRPVARPSYGAHIERLLGTVLKEIHSLPGTTFSEPKEKGEDNSEKEAAMTLSELEEWLAVFITQVYHQRVHSELRTSPIKRYEEGILGTKDHLGTGLPHRVLDEDRLRLDFMPHLERTPELALPERLTAGNFMRLGVKERRQLLNLVSRLLADWPTEFLAFCRANNLGYSEVISCKSKGSFPYWFYRVVDEHLSCARYRSTDQELESLIDYLRRKNGHDPTRQEVLPYLSEGVRRLRFRKWGLLRVMGNERECPYCQEATIHE